MAGGAFVLLFFNGGGVLPPPPVVHPGHAFVPGGAIPVAVSLGGPTPPAVGTANPPEAGFPVLPVLTNTKDAIAARPPTSDEVVQIGGVEKPAVAVSQGPVTPPVIGDPGT